MRQRLHEIIQDGTAALNETMLGIGRQVAETILYLEQWLRAINESAADSLLEAFEELLTLHRLKVPALLRKALHSTNIIESVFSRVRACEKNIKRYRSSNMAQRWLAS